MFNSTYVRGGDTNNNIDINSVSGTLVKNYRNSFFYQCKEGSKEYDCLFDPENPRIYVSYKIKDAIAEKEWGGRDYCTVYYKQVVVLQSILTDILPHYSLTNDILLICVFGGLINGFCISLCLIAGATSGGSDFLSLLMAKKGITNSWYYIFMGNVILIIMSGFTFGWDKALYSIIFQFTSTQVINTMHLRYKRDTLFIITDFPSPVYEVIKDITNHAGTIFQGTGCYMKKTKNLVYSVVASDEVKDVIREVKKIDKDAFINIVKTDQVIGKFYQRPEE